MNIAFFCNSHGWGGLELNVYNYASWFRELNNDVVIVCPDDSKLYSESIKSGLKVESIHTRFKHADLREALRLKKIFKKHLTEAVIICLSKDIHISVFADLIPGYHFKKVFLQAMTIGVNKRDIIHTFLYNQLDLWIAPIVWLRDNTIEKTKIKKEKIHVISNAIDSEKFIYSEISKDQARKMLQLPEDIFITGIIGRIDHLKGHHVLVEAIKILRDKGEKIHALIVGDDKYTSDKEYNISLRNKIKTLNLENLIIFRPFTEDVRPIFKALDIYTMTSLNESFGMVTIEAMASGIPIAGAKAGATQYIIEDGRNGLLFKSEDAADLAEKILILKNQPDLSYTLIQNALISVNENYSKSSFCNKIIKLISSKN